MEWSSKLLNAAEMACLAERLTARVVANIASMSPKNVFYGQTDAGRARTGSLPADRLCTLIEALLDMSLPENQRYACPLIATVLKGRLTYTIGAALYEAREGDWFISPPDVPRREFRLPSNASYHLFWFRLAHLHEVGETLHSSREGITLRMYQPEKPPVEIEKAMRMILEAPNQPLESLRCNVMRLVVWWFDNINNATLATSAHAHPIVERIQAVLEQSDVQGLSVASLSAQLGVSRFHLSKVFRRFTGQTVSLAIRKARVERARRHLADSTLPIKEIAWLVGFSRPEHFARAFHQLLGVSPHAYRNKAHKQPDR
jgi:AraC-like DNA-binding protein